MARDGGVLKIWLNRPETKNALSKEMTDELNLVLDNVRDDRSIRAIVLRGSGGVFCAGGDIKSFKTDMQMVDADEVAKSNRSFGNLLIKQVVAELKRLGIQVDSRVFMISRSGVS